jgi:hypothetical protein
VSDSKIDPSAVKVHIEKLDAADAKNLRAINDRWRELQDALSPDDPGRTGRAIVASDISGEAKERLVELLIFLTRRGPNGFFSAGLRLQGVALLRTCLRAMQPAWDGEDWELLQPAPKRLLLYMRGRERADVADVCENVWLTADVSEGSIHGCINKANRFLEKRHEKRTLHKMRGQPCVTWQ